MDAIQLSDVSSWPSHFDSLFERVGAVFPRVDLHHQARGYVRGLLASFDRKNSWQLAEHLGHDKPFGLQRLLSRASWDVDALRDELVRYACDHLGANEDRALYLPESWCDNRARCDEAGVPDDVGFKTKPQLAMEMIGRGRQA